MPKAGERRPIKHGTPQGYQMEGERGLERCADCCAARNDEMTARRIQRGQQVVKVSVEVLGTLLIAAAGTSGRQDAVDWLGWRTAAACAARSPYLEENV